MNVVDAAITARAPRGPQIYSHGTLTLGRLSCGGQLPEQVARVS
jgi:hypothetical protein